MSDFENIEMYPLLPPNESAGPNRADLLRMHPPIETSYKKPLSLVHEALAHPERNLGMLLEGGSATGRVLLDELIDEVDKVLIVGHLEMRNKKTQFGQLNSRVDYDGSLDSPGSPKQFSWRRMDGVEMRIAMPSPRAIRWMGRLGLEPKATISYRRDWFVDPSFLVRRGVESGDIAAYGEVENVFVRLNRDWDPKTQSFRNKNS